MSKVIGIDLGTTNTVVAAVVAYVAVQVLGRRFDEALREGLRHDPEVGFKIEERVPED